MRIFSPCPWGREKKILFHICLFSNRVKATGQISQIINQSENHEKWLIIFRFMEKTAWHMNRRAVGIFFEIDSVFLF